MPSIAVTNAYEAIYIVDPTLGEEQISAITGRYRQIIETQGGTVDKVEVWERRKLAYVIKGRSEGIYVIMQFKGKPSVEAELRRIFQISEDQIRAMIVRIDEPEAADAAAAPAESAAQAAPVPQPAAAPEIPDAAPEIVSSVPEPAPDAAPEPAEALAA